jgi:hypothetical protein
MKVIFAGPTLHGADLPPNTDYELRPPARQGDIYRAVQEGANVIGLIDGVYEYVPAIWHKEILYGLSLGVHTFGAASMGALRAAECAAFGMVGIGEIFDGYMRGELEDDADVAQAHGPQEMGYLPLNEPLVNVRATISRCAKLGLVTQQECEALLNTAHDMFFKDRTYRNLARLAINDGARSAAILAHLRDNRVNIKLQDAEQLIDVVIKTPDQRFVPQFDWTFEATTFWKMTFPDA